MEAADVGGVNLTFSPSDEKLAGTKGRALDHIGFEIDGLEAFCKKLEAEGVAFDRPYQKIPELGVTSISVGSFVTVTSTGPGPGSSPVQLALPSCGFVIVQSPPR